MHRANPGRGVNPQGPGVVDRPHCLRGRGGDLLLGGEVDGLCTHKVLQLSNKLLPTVLGLLLLRKLAHTAANGDGGGGRLRRDLASLLAVASGDWGRRSGGGGGGQHIERRQKHGERREVSRVKGGERDGEGRITGNHRVLTQGLVVLHLVGVL